MADNKIIFDAVRPMTDEHGFNVAGRTNALDAACAAFLISRNKDDIFHAVRPMMDEHGFNLAGRTDDLNGACDRFLASADAAAVPTAAPAARPDRDDRFLALFSRLANSEARPEDVRDMARSFSAHAPAYGQDARRERIAEFVAQISNETGGFTTFSENLNYSVQGLLATFGRHRISADDAARYGRAGRRPANKAAIANIIYGGPWGVRNLGNTQPGDGWRYRGQGALQLTGRGNFRRFGQALGLDLEGHPELAADPAVSVQIALEFFKQGKVNAAIDAGDFTEARRITNGGKVGLDNVARLRRLALQVLA